MKKFQLPFGKELLDLELEDSRFQGVLVSKAEEYRAKKSQEELVLESLEHPINSEKLRDIAKGKKNCVLISSDHTRPVPSKIITPLILKELRKGNPDIDITILVSTGMHRPTTKEELISKYGEEIVANEKIVIHQAKIDEDMRNIGTLPSGGELVLNKVALDTELLISEGFIEPHFFAGFSGGRKSILPGVASKKTVLANHCSEFIDSPYARTGILEGNPIHRDMLYAAEKANLRFIVNVVINSDKEIINCFSGNFNDAHIKGTEFLSTLCGVKRQEADIAITTNGGYPLDQNIYQSVKGMTAAEATVKDGGVIIIASKCNDGHGGDDFYNTIKNASPLQKAMDEILSRSRNETVFDQWESQILLRILLKHTVIMVTNAPKEMVEEMHMKYATSLDEALKMADEILGNHDGKITVIPDGVAVMVR